MSKTKWPAEAHGVKIPRDAHGDPKLFTTVTSGVIKLHDGVNMYRRMTKDEVQHWIDSKTGDTKVRPVQIDGKIP